MDTQNTPAPNPAAPAATPAAAQPAAAQPSPATPAAQPAAAIPAQPATPATPAIHITVDGIQVACHPGEMVLSAAERAGIEIPHLCHDPRLAPYGACSLCVIEVEGSPKLARACGTKVADGMVVHTDTPRLRASRKIALELLMADHSGQCVGPCALECPAHTDVQAYIKQIALGNDREAVRIIKTKIPIPASIGRVCPHPCETKCRRQFVEQPLSIAYLKAFTADKDLSSADPYVPQVALDSGKSIAIVGGGPAGLAAAFRLRLHGHRVTVYDAMPQMGGMLRYGIPQYRLPKQVLAREIRAIEDLGVVMRPGFQVGRDATLAELAASHDAVLAAPGAWTGTSVGCPGEDLQGVVSGIAFLRQVNSNVVPDRADLESVDPASTCANAASSCTDGTCAVPDVAGRCTGLDLTGKNVAVVGGGNTAMDACRTALRCGAANVYVVYRRTRQEAPADDQEIQEAIEEGVQFKFLTNPARILGAEDRVTAIELQVMQLGEPDESGRRKPVPVEGCTQTYAVDMVISAIGQRLDPHGFEDLPLNRRGNIVAAPGSFATACPGIFAAGDATNHGAGIAIEAIAEADSAADAIDAYLTTDVDFWAAPAPADSAPTPALAPNAAAQAFVAAATRVAYVSHKDPDLAELAARTKLPRATMPVIDPAARCRTFDEVALGLPEETARSEAARCLECGCHDYADCKLVRYANLQDIDVDRLAGAKHPAFAEDTLQAIERDQGKCILCNQCVRACHEIAGKGILGLVGRGYNAVIRPEFLEADSDAVADACAACHACVDTCPTGALKLLWS